MSYCKFCMQEIRTEARFCPHCGKDRSAETPPHHLPPGTLLRGRYRLGAALGEGGFGITYVGLDEALELRVAIKEFFPYGFVTRLGAVSTQVTELSDEGKAEFFQKGKTRFMQEARVLAKFTGARGIVDVRDFFEENNTAYIVMEFVDGVTLKQYLKEHKTLSPEETLQLLTPVMESLKLLHKENLIHRDISPDNIMLMDNVNGEVKLLDFGAARSVGGDQKSLSVMLKPGFAPEEQYRSKGKQGPWTDVYALCATMYKCITGIRPDESPDRLYDDTLKAPSALGVAIDPAFEQTLLKGLAVRAEDRIQSVDRLLVALTQENPPARQKTLPAGPPKKTDVTQTAFAPNATIPLKKTDQAKTQVEPIPVTIPVTPPAAETKAPKIKGGKKKKRGVVLISAAVILSFLAGVFLVREIFFAKAGKTVVFGSYPQSLVSDSAVLHALRAMEKDWISYGYFSKEYNEVGDSTKKDYMRYADLSYNGEKYRAVTFDTYRPTHTGMGSTIYGTSSNQDENGYNTKAIYYFKFEPLKWRVLDPKTGLVLCESVIDAQQIQNLRVNDNEVYYCNEEKTNYVNAYDMSDIRRWLNDDFYNTAFSSEEQAQIGRTYLDNSAYSADYAEFNSEPTTDRIFLLSYADVHQKSYGFPEASEEGAEELIAYGTDYAECQGLNVAENSAAAFWWLRTPGKNSLSTTFVSYEGCVYIAGGLDSVYSMDGGVRPAFAFTGKLPKTTATE